MPSSELEFSSPEGNDEMKTEYMLNLINRNTVLTTTDLSLPTETFLKAAISLKDLVVRQTWREAVGGGAAARGVIDPTMCTGLLGTAFLCFRAYEATGNRNDLLLCSEIVDTCATAACASSRHVTFLRGKGGVYALGTVVAYLLRDHQRRDLFLSRFQEVAKERALPVGPEEGGFGMSYDLQYGRAGFLWAAMFINKYLGQEAISSEILTPIVDAVIAGGRAGSSDNLECPLMYRWHGTRYLGAGTGLAGTLQVLLHFPLSIDDAEDVKGTIRYLMSKRSPESGNYPSIEGNPRNDLVQWCHGATGMTLTLCKASKVFPSDRDFREATIEAGEVVWKSGLVKNIGLADGTAGNAYAFLSLYRLTGEDEYLERAQAFSSFVYHNAALTAEDHIGGDDHDYSLFHGLAGIACLWFDLLEPENSRFPGYEI